MGKCLYCEKEVKNKSCNTSCQNRHLNPLRRLVYAPITKTCPKCDKRFEVQKVKSRNFCSPACANTRIRTPETKLKISESCNLYYFKVNNGEIIPTDRKRKSINLHTKNCLNCGKEYSKNKSRLSRAKYCSRSCGTTYKNTHQNICSKGGLKSVQSQNRRSKNEVYFSELCSAYFGNVKNNEPIFNGWDADVILEDIKYAVLWNGKWHYEKLSKQHSLEQVQNRDRIKMKEIEKAGYVAYIIKDMGKYNKSFVEEEFSKFLDYLKNEKFV